MLVGEGPNRLLGQNYDFAMSHGALFVNGRGKLKESLGHPGEQALHWTSRYSSVVFSQFGRELPMSGMNERGLTVQGLWNEDSPFPSVDATRIAALNELQWIQYQLDQHATVDEVVASPERVPLKKVIADLHFVVCEASGRCALVQYDAGRLQILRDDSWSPAAITNSTHARSLWHFKAVQAKDFGSLSGRKSSLDAYAKAAWLVSHEAPTIKDTEAAGWLHGALQRAKLDLGFGDLFSFVTGRPPSVTAWSVVFSPGGRWVEWRTRENDRIRRLDLTGLFRACTLPDLALDLNTGQGDVAGLMRPDAQAHNQRIVSLAYRSVEKKFSLQEQDELVRYAGQLRCVDPK